MKGAISKASNIKFGVPQGSDVGPLLFLVMINDLDRDGNIKFFADDTTPRVKRHDNRQGIQHLMDAASWFEENSLKLNLTKTQNLADSLARDAP